MLIVFYGPSCVGRTTLMRLLAQQDRWRFVPVLTTRALRSGESEKRTVTESELTGLAEVGQLLTISRSFGNSYSWLRSDLQEAADSTDFWMLDFRFSLGKLLVSLRPREIIVLPPNEETLRRRIANAGRSEREAAIITDYREHYSSARLEGMAGANTIIVVNNEGKAEEAARRIRQKVLAVGEAYGC